MSKVRSDNLLILDIFRKSGFSGKTALVLSTWFGSGCLPIAPGTFGTLAAVPLILVLNNFGIWYSAITLLIVVGIAVWSAGLAQDLLEKKDPSEIVIDEVAGFLLATAFLPFSWLSLGLVFFLFRFFSSVFIKAFILGVILSVGVLSDSDDDDVLSVSSDSDIVRSVSSGEEITIKECVLLLRIG